MKSDNTPPLIPMKHHEEDLVDGKPVHGIWALLNVVGGVSGLLSLLVIVLMGGQYIKQLEVNTRDIAEIRQSGSPAVKTLAASIEAEVSFRRASDEAFDRRIGDVRSDFGQRVQNITGLLEKLVEQQTQLITLIKVQQQMKGP